ncbi:MAG: type IV secretion system DNA-binding domain-containing protein [Acidiferrobacter sp.]
MATTNGINDINWVTSDRPVVSAISAAIGGALSYVGGVQLLARFATPDHAFLPLSQLPHTLFTIARDYHGVLPMPWGWLPAACGIAGLAAGGVLGWIGATRQSERPVDGRGYTLYRTPDRIAHALRVAPDEVPGVHIHPLVQISCADEVKHIMIVGGTGAGKTTILWPILEEARARGDRMLVFDSKGDFTSGWPGIGQKDFMLLSPTDYRSARWQIGRDVRTRLEAQSLAETLIKEVEKGDPMWSSGARALLVGLISDLQTRLGLNWGFDDLAKTVSETLADFEKLKAVIVREDPASLYILGGADAKGMTKTTHGFVVNMGAYMTHVINLGVSANDLKKNPAWSVREWLRGKQPKVAILGFGSKSLSQAFIASIIEQAAQQLTVTPDVKPDKRRIWFVFDEVPKAGKIPGITDAFTTLRSKGVRVIIGFQSLAQIREYYSKDTATTWAGQCSIKIIGNLGSDEDQAWGSKILGEHEVDRFQGQVSTTRGMGAAQHNQSWERVREPVLMPASFGKELLIRRNWRGKKLGPRALVIGGGEAAILDWGFPDVRERRSARVGALWNKPGAKRPLWGIDPPKVVEAPVEGVEEKGKRKAGETERKGQDNAVKIINSQGANQGPEQGGIGTDAGAKSGSPGEQKASAREEEAVMGHLQEGALDAVVPGAGLVTKIIGLATDAGPSAGALHGAVKKTGPEQKPTPEPGPDEGPGVDDLDPDFP